MHFTVRFLSFWQNVDVKGPDDCWLWQGPMYGKYGFYRRGHELFGTFQAHRVAWTLANGAQIENGLYVCHSCDTPPCCNPTHLWLGTNKDNMQDASQKGRVNGENNGMFGKKHSEGTLAKLSVAAKRQLKDPKDHPMYGKSHSAATKAKIAADVKHRCESPEYRAKLSEACKLREARKRRQSPIR